MLERFEQVARQALEDLNNVQDLKALEEFQKKERTYEQAIAAYQKKLVQSGGEGKNTEIEDLRKRLGEKEREISELKNTIQKLNQKLKQAETGTFREQVGPPDEEYARLENWDRLLSAKEEALELKARLLQTSRAQ